MLKDKRGFIYRGKLRALPSLIFITLFLLLLFTDVNAQPIRPGEEPSSQANRYEKGAEERKKEIEERKLKPPEVKIEEKEEEKVEAVAVSFVLKDIKVTGSTIFSQEDFRPIYESYLNKEVTFQDLFSIVDKIKAKYKEKGYLTTTAYIPEQEIVEGIVEIRVVEGNAGEVNVEGNKWFPGSLIKRYIHLKKNEILNILKLQRDLLRLNQNPDLDVRVVIVPGKETGTSDLTVKVKDKFPWHIGTGVDNQGTRLVGRWRTSFSSRSTNLLGLNDSLFVNTMRSSSSCGNFISYLFPINTYGTKLGLDITVFLMRLGKDYKDFDITGKSQIFTPHMSSELYLSENFQLNSDMGMEIKSMERKTREIPTVNDQLRMPYVAFDLTKTDSFFGGGQTTFLPRFTFSPTHLLGASTHNDNTRSRNDVGESFFKYEHTIRRTQKLLFDSYATIRSQFQIPTRTLPSSEQLQLGGAYSIRGYPEGDYLADTGASLNIDWLFPMYIIPKGWKLPFADMPLRNQIEPAVFVDVGTGKIKSVSGGEKKYKFLMGLGGGLRVRFNKNLYLRLDWARRVGDKPTEGEGPSSFYMTFQFEL